MNLSAAFDTNNDTFAYRVDAGKNEMQNAEATLWGKFHTAKKSKAKEESLGSEDATPLNARRKEDPSMHESDIVPDNIEIRLDGTSMNIIVGLFGEGEKVDSTTVRVPYWIAEKLYKAWKGLPVPEFDPTEQTEPTRGAEILTEPSSAEAYTYGRLRGTTAPPGLDDIMYEERKWYEEKVAFFGDFFPNRRVQNIQDVVKQCGCDYEEAAKRLVVLNDKIEANREQYIHATNNRIKYSDMPTPIIPRRKGKKEAPQAPSVFTITEEYADFLEETAIQHEEKAKGEQSAANNSSQTVASYRHQQATEYRKKAKECRDRAYSIRVQLSGDGIDMHNLTREEAIRALVLKIHICEEQGRRKFRVITGYGKSNGGKCVIKQAVKRYLGNYSIRFEEAPGNRGELIVFV